MAFYQVGDSQLRNAGGGALVCVDSADGLSSTALERACRHSGSCVKR